jgi:hypothetical protein
MRIIIYVEGPSDRLAMQELLADLLNRLELQGIKVDFIPTDGKKRLMLQTPVKAANTLRNDPQTVVVALPDLYPPNFVFPHFTADELVQALQNEFAQILIRKNLADDTRLNQRFRVFCFKHDLESIDFGCRE